MGWFKEIQREPDHVEEREKNFQKQTTMQTGDAQWEYVRERGRTDVWSTLAEHPKRLRERALEIQSISMIIIMGGRPLNHNKGG